MRKYLLCTLVLLFTFSLPLFSIEVITGEEDQPITNSKVYEDDVLMAGDKVTFSGQGEDLTLAGKEVLFSGTSLISARTFGGSVTVSGQVGNDLLAAGKTVEISGIINDTVITAGKTVIVTEDAVINGDLIAAGSEVKILGTVKGDLYAGARVVTIGTNIGGDAKIGAGKIEFTEDGSITGNLNYWTNLELSDSQKTKVGGSIVYEEKMQKEFGHKKGDFDFKKDGEGFVDGFFMFMGIWCAIASLIGGLLVLCLPYFRKLQEEKSEKNFWYMFLFGLIPFFIYPAVLILLMVLGITLPLAGLLFMAGLPVLFITQIIGITLLGQYLFKRFKWKKENRFLFFLFGFIFYFILGLIPFVGMLSLIFFASLGWGFILEKLFQKKLAE